MASRFVNRKVLIPIVVVVLLLVLVVAFLPMMISRGLGHGLVQGAIENQIEGSADFQQLRVTWRGPQRISGLRLVDGTGFEAAVIDARVEQGLLPLIFSRRMLDVTVAGVVRAELYEDGSISLARLAREREEPPTADEQMSLEGVPGVTVDVDGVQLILHDVGADQQIVVDDLRGMFVYVPGAELRLNLEGETASGELRGTLAISGDAPGLFDAEGRFAPDGTPVLAEARLASIPVVGVDVPSVLEGLVINVQTQNLTQGIAMSLRGEGTIENEQQSRFSGEFRVRNPIKQDGTIDIDLSNIEGRLTGEGVPSSLIQPAFNNTPIVLARDIGSTIDVDLALPPEDGDEIHLRAVGPRAEVELTAAEREGWWLSDHVVVRTGQADPDLVEGYIGVRPEAATDVEIVLTSLALPPFSEALDARPLGLGSIAGTLRMNGPTTLLVPRGAEDEEGEAAADSAQEPMRFTVSGVDVRFDAPQIGDAVYVNGALVLDGGQVTVDETIVNLADAEGRLDAKAAEPIGTITMRQLPYAVAAQFMPEREALLREVVGEAMDLTVRTQRIEEGLRAELEATGAGIAAHVAGVRMPDVLRLLASEIQLNVTPEAGRSVLADLMDEPVTLRQPATVTVQIAQTDFPGSAPFDYQLVGVPIAAMVTADDLALGDVPGLDEPVGVTGLRASVRAALGDEGTYSAEGQAGVVRPGADQRAATVTYNINATASGDQPMVIDGALAITELAIPAIEAMLGQDADAIGGWVGRGGALRAQLRAAQARYEATLTAELERLKGVFAVAMADEILSVNTEGADLNLAAGALEDLLNPEEDSQLVEIVGDVPFRLVLQSTMPMSLFTEEPYEPELVDINAQLTGGPLVMISEGEQTTLSNAVVSLASEPVADGVDFVIRVDADIDESAVTGRPGEIDVQARLQEMLRGDVPLNLETAVVDLQASVVRAPAAIADSLLNMHGYFLSAVGHEIDATINANDFSRDSGTIAMNVDAPHGWMRMAGEGRGGLLALAEGSPLEGELELTPLLRERILGNLHPLLGDVVDMAQPLRLIVSDALVPLDGDISRLAADIELAIGEVDFDAQSPLFALLAAARVADVDRLDGFIEPVRAQIRDGVVSYQQFMVKIDRLDIPYQGQIDLNNRTVNLRTALPLGELFLTGIREIPPEARGISVPIVTRGLLGDVQTQIDPEFDLARALLEAGVQRGLEDILPRDRLPFDFRDLFPRR